MRPIDAERLKEGLEYHYHPTDQEYEEDRRWAVGYNAGLDRALYSLAYAPTLTLDDLRPHGRWLVHEGDCEDDKVPGDWSSHEWLCSVCYAEICYEDPMEYRFLPKFCHNCGADMRGGLKDA